MTLALVARGELRFGVGDEGRPGSRYWTLRCAATRPDVYLRHSRVGAFLGFSFHQDPNYWHAKLVRRVGAEPEYIGFARPAEFRPGSTKAIVVQMTAGLAGWGLAASKLGVMWHQPSSSDRVVEFAVVIERPGADLHNWPGRASGTAYIGSLPMADEGTAVVVAQETLPQEARHQVPITEAQRDELRDNLRAAIDRGGDPWTMVWGTSDDGTVVVREGPVRPASP